MTRWIMIALTLIGFAGALLARSPGVLGIALLVGFIGLCGTVLSIAAERVSSNTRPETAMLQPDVIAAIRERAERQASAVSTPRPATPVRRAEP